MTVDLHDQRDAQARGWGRPPVTRDHVVDVRAGGIVVPVHRRIAPLIAFCLDQTVARGYPLHKNECWGYAPRHILNDPSKAWSNHAWALAVDLNAPENGYGTRGDFPATIAHKLWNRWGFRWGGDYQHSPRDPMHFEFMGTPDDATYLIRRLGGDNGHARHRPPSKPHAFPLRGRDPAYHAKQLPDGRWTVGSRGQHVVEIQLALKLHPADGLYGPATRDAVKQFQRSRRLRVDGACGPLTWHVLFG